MMVFFRWKQKYGKSSATPTVECKVSPLYSCIYQTDRVYLQDITYVLHVPFFSSPEPKAEVKLAFLIALYLFSVVNVVIVVIYKLFSSKNHWNNFSQSCNKASVRGFVFVQIMCHVLFKGKKVARKIHCQLLKIFSRTTGSISTNLCTKHSMVKENLHDS